MSTPILATKLYFPSPRPEVVPRPRLIERLSEGPRSGRKLTLISAPAGFGKTTLVSEWIHAGVRSRKYEVSSKEYGVGSGKDRENASPPTPYSDECDTFALPTPSFAWLSLDEGDNDLTRFLTYFVAALQTLAPNVGAGVLAALQSPQPPPVETILTALLNEITTYAEVC